MIKKLPAFVVVPLYCLGFSMPGLAAQQLKEVEAKVELHAVEIDAKYGVLLDYQERNDLKLDLIAKQVVLGMKDGSDLSDAAKSAFETYQVTDLYEQRKLLIKIESLALEWGTRNGGPVPDYP